MERFEQKPTPPNVWLFEDEGEYRFFYKAITMPIGSSLLPECTDEEKTAWESSRKEIQEELIEVVDDE